MKSLPGEASWHAMGHTSLASEGKTSTGDTHGQPPDFPDSQTQSSTAWETESVDSKARICVHQARRPVPNDCTRTRPDRWSTLGVVNVNLAACLGSASQFEGKQNFHIPCVGSELHATPRAPQFSSFSPSPLHPAYLTPSRARICRERAPPPNDTPTTSALNAGSRPTCRVVKPLLSSAAPPRPITRNP